MRSPYEPKILLRMDQTVLVRFRGRHQQAKVKGIAADGYKIVAQIDGQRSLREIYWRDVFLQEGGTS